jgi:hypothetical protein
LIFRDRGVRIGGAVPVTYDGVKFSETIKVVKASPTIRVLASA